MTTLETYEHTQAQIRKELRRLDAALLDHDRNASSHRTGHDQAQVDELNQVLQQLQTLTTLLKGD